ncbi:Tryptophan synthase beta subunit-like PLP-dependent enzymes superfamily [Kalmanozyma brasiliensis GHG001]|uniref:Threonine dehydratase n=1 Tax=Kalmanozyma brasiliensis (strain GHG001) TaxID=1365824 RepID=V5EY29_KALBG|nr:Tryptophan synthase beta subunit-like PLP-dependent enzymes superfamily [Kalmanozyma brasiliensis GHG001]EST08548.1 Tryptophan synthase beta subunit-like PLP-dependent enzymes superfamily [Kalmanozyma brasiliensis GHG001]
MAATASSSAAAYLAGPFPTGRALTEHDVTPSVSPTPSEENAPPTHLYTDLPPHLMQADNTPDYLRLILNADVYDLVKQTPLQPGVNLSTKLGCQVLLKREDLQPVFSFKLRGAFNMMQQLDSEQKWKGVIACSAGNHAQGVAMAGAHLSIPCTIVMPKGTPEIKTANVKRMGAKVVLFGQDFDEAKAECTRLSQAYGLTIIPPFDHPRVIAGQGTIGVEICRQTDMSTVDAIFCCVGGGGLLAGVAAYIKRIAPPHVKVIGVETFDADALAQSLEAGHRVLLNEVGLFADGTAVRIVGEECFRICRQTVDGVVRVSNDEICAAIKDTFEDTRSIPEPSGALAVAGMKRYIATHNLQGSGKKFVALVSGANMNFGRLRFVAERAELGENKEALLSVEIPEEPGAFLKLHNHINPRAVTEFSYRYGDSRKAQILLSFMLNGTKAPTAAAASTGAMPVPEGIAEGANSLSSSTASINDPVALSNSLAASSLGNGSELDSILAALTADGMTPIDLSGDEVSKSHLRYLVGGKTAVPNERIFRFEFPERPGALRKFLVGMQSGWNVSLFHYRNHGADVGKILLGIQAPEADGQEFDKFLKELGYQYHEETDNPVLRRYLGPTSA